MTNGSQRRMDEGANGLGIAGFVISLVGLCSGGLLSPIGLILSIIALRREPRGLAIAGVVIGALGSCGIILSLIFVPLILIGVLIAVGASAAAVGLAAAIGGPELEAAVEMQILSALVEKFEDREGRLPLALADVVDSNATTSGLLRDPWGNQYVYVIEPDGSGFRIFSMGVDGIPGTADDIQRGEFDWPPKSRTPTAPAPAPAPEPVDAPEPASETEE